jgi:hypothetical protein
MALPAQSSTMQVARLNTLVNRNWMHRASATLAFLINQSQIVAAPIFAGAGACIDSISMRHTRSQGLLLTAWHLLLPASMGQNRCITACRNEQH